MLVLREDFLAATGTPTDAALCKETRGNRAQFREMIEMSVAELENTIAIKGLRQVGE